SWYEVGLAPEERKQRGHFSTPPELVKHILDACGYTPKANLARVRVLDPACGSGNFLAEAARRLVAFSTRIGLDQAAQAALMQRNLWGFDPDPVACFLAEMQLNAMQHNHRLHIHQADALTLPWEPYVDLFVANPPYLAAKNADLSGYQSTRQRGQADSYLLFLSLALQALRTGGWMGLVLPDPLLARTNAANERAYLLTEATIHHIWHLSGVFAADVGAVVIIAQKCPPQHLHQVSWVRGKWQSGTSTTGRVPQSLLRGQPGAEFRYLLSSRRGAAIERLRAYGPSAEQRRSLGDCVSIPSRPRDGMPAMPRRLVPLSEFLTISRGEELGKNSPCITELANRSCDRLSYPILLGGIDIRPYTMPTATHRIAREAVAKPLERYLSAKLLVVKSTDRLQAALDLQGHVALQTLYLLHPRPENTSEDDLYFFLALLNSRLLGEYVYTLHTAYKWVQPQIEQSVLARLPIPLVEAAERRHIIQLSRLLMDACSGGDRVVEWNQDIYRIYYEEQESAIGALYESVLPGLYTL
ncbi:MAG TPA: N-6 DNA methylase, partial [Ktedonobacteraceae bacterium]|nr:N-6 DNA methylase [Ktedonobacteraceae bacterium]